MNERRISMSSLVFGLLFLAIGGMFLLEETDAIDIDAIYVVPIVLIGIGIAVLASGRRST